MLNYTQKILARSFAIQKKLFVYDSGNFDPFPSSGIRATIFGGTGLIGRPIATTLGGIGSHLVMPVAKENVRHYQYPKQLKLTGHTHKTWVQYGADLRDQRFIQDMIKNSNVVINLVGPRKKLKKKQDFDYVNIDIAQRIAKACKKMGVLRLIHFSAAGASANSQSLDFQTKHQGQKAVRAEFPQATIFRPCNIYGQNDTFAHLILRQASFFLNRLAFVYDDCETLKQPVRDYDVAEAVLNALKLDQTKGQTYELGGPHQLTMREIHEIIFNMLNFPNIKLAYVNRDLALAVAKRIYNWQFFGVEVIKKKSIPEIVSGNFKTIQDLHIQPVSFKSGIFEIMREFIFEPQINDEQNQN